MPFILLIPRFSDEASPWFSCENILILSEKFSKISREITVAARLGDKNPDMNPRLRTAIQAAKQANPAPSATQITKFRAQQINNQAPSTKQPANI